MTPPVFLAVPGADASGALTLTGDEGHHAATVKRMRVGEAVWLTDGAGTRWECTVSAVRRGELDATVERVVLEEPPRPRLLVVQALAKGGRDEDAVEAMTEIGVDEIIGWSAARSVAKWTDRTGTKWQSTADAAARQSRRSWWPSIAGPMSTAEVAEQVADASLALVLHEDASESFVSLEIPVDGEVVVVVGPEGGITDAELTALAASGARTVRLGTTVLRSSTAGVAALSAICARTRWS